MNKNTNNFMKAMLYQYPEVIPTRVSLLPGTWSKYRKELSALVERHPTIFNIHQNRNALNYDSMPEKYSKGQFTDAWGCVWSNLNDGLSSIVTHHPYPTRESVRNIKAPEVDIGTPHGFMYLRLADLRGFEEIMIDFAEEPPELLLLIDTVLNYNVRQIERNIEKNANEVLVFGDDLGMQNGLAMGPEKWRKYMKPCYKKLYDICHREGRYVYMHTDGRIHEIIPDLKDCGVNVVNPQFRANGLDNLVRVCKDQICIDLDLDRQMFPFCTPKDIDDHIREAVEKLAAPRGGLMLIAECAPDVPIENIEAICNAMEKYRVLSN